MEAVAGDWLRPENSASMGIGRVGRTGADSESGWGESDRLLYRRFADRKEYSIGMSEGARYSNRHYATAWYSGEREDGAAMFAEQRDRIFGRTHQVLRHAIHYLGGAQALRYRPSRISPKRRLSVEGGFGIYYCRLSELDQLCIHPRKATSSMNI